MYDHSYIYTGDVFALLLRGSSTHRGEPRDLGQDVPGDSRLKKIPVEREALRSQDWSELHLNDLVRKSPVRCKIWNRILFGRQCTEGGGLGADCQGNVGLRTSHLNAFQGKRQGTDPRRSNPSDSHWCGTRCGAHKR